MFPVLFNVILGVFAYLPLMRFLRAGHGHCPSGEAERTVDADNESEVTESGNSQSCARKQPADSKQGLVSFPP